MNDVLRVYVLKAEAYLSEVHHSLLAEQALPIRSLVKLMKGSH